MSADYLWGKPVCVTRCLIISLLTAVHLFSETQYYFIPLCRVTMCVLADLGVSSLVLNPPDDIYQIVDLYHRPKIS